MILLTEGPRVVGLPDTEAEAPPTVHLRTGKLVSARSQPLM